MQPKAMKIETHGDRMRKARPRAEEILVKHSKISKRDFFNLPLRVKKSYSKPGFKKELFKIDRMREDEKLLSDKKERLEMLRSSEKQIRDGDDIDLTILNSDSSLEAIETIID